MFTVLMKVRLIKGLIILTIKNCTFPPHKVIKYMFSSERSINNSRLQIKAFSIDLRTWRVIPVIILKELEIYDYYEKTPSPWS